MRIILETSEILVILGRHFNTELDPTKVTIRTDPHLEIEITGLAMSGGAAPRAGGGTGDTFTPPPGEVVRDDSSIAEVLQESEELQRAERNTLKVLPSNIEDEVS